MAFGGIAENEVNKVKLARYGAFLRFSNTKIRLNIGICILSRGFSDSITRPTCFRAQFLKEHEAQGGVRRRVVASRWLAQIQPGYDRPINSIT